MLTRGGGGAGGQWLRFGRGFVSVLRRIAGMPDYEAHVTHLRACHPDIAVPTERQYFDQFVRAKSGGAGSRCC
jgi:uncharacterized short protein YbdD (DUF466 family)